MEGGWKSGHVDGRTHACMQGCRHEQESERGQAVKNKGLTDSELGRDQGLNLWSHHQASIPSLAASQLFHFHTTHCFAFLICNQ